MSPVEFLKKMRILEQKSTEEASFIEEIHRDADNLMCEQLRNLGYQEAADVFALLQKKYSYNYFLVSE